MILIDFSHLSYRNLFSTISTLKYNLKKENGKFVTKDFIGMYFHKILLSLLKIQYNFQKEYGEIFLLFDSKKNWRKEFKKAGYKENRKKGREESEINFDEFFKYLEEFKEFLKNLGFNTIEIEYLEADDLAFILPKKIKDEKILLVSEDKDWKQILLHYDNVDMYFPMKNELIKNSKELKNEIKLFRFKHILIGDKVDDINSIFYNVEFSEEFKKFLQEKNIYEFCVSEFEENYDYQKYYDEFLEKNNSEIFKKIRFGEKTAEKMIKEKWDYETIKKKFKINDVKTLKRNFKINRMLIDLKKIPKEYISQAFNVIENILNEKNKIDYKKIDEFLTKYNLVSIKKNLKINNIDLSSVEIYNSLFEENYDYKSKTSNKDISKNFFDFINIQNKEKISNKTSNKSSNKSPKKIKSLFS